MADCIDCKVSYQCGTRGLVSRAHNIRDFDRELWNVDGHINYSRTKLNLTLLDDEPDLDFFRAMGFEESIKEYNAKPAQQKNKSRQITDVETFYKYHKRDRYEIIVQLGDEGEFNELCAQVGEKRAREIHTDFLKKAWQHIQDENPAFYFYGGYIHHDERVPHLHADYIPLADGASVKQTISNDGALKTMGFKRKPNQPKNAHWTKWEEDRRCKIENLAKEFTSEFEDVKFNILDHEPWDRSKRRLTTTQYHAMEAEKKQKAAEEKAKIADKIREETLKETEDFVLSLEPTPNKTVKGFFGKTTEIPKTEDELNREHELLATQAIIRENQKERERNAQNNKRNAKEREEIQSDQNAMEEYLAEQQALLKHKVNQEVQSRLAEMERERKKEHNEFENSRAELAQQIKAARDAQFAALAQKEVYALEHVPLPTAAEILVREHNVPEQQRTNDQQTMKGADEWL